jgi:CubicO group peptidase (beta-lactamase class C family)
LLKCLCQTEEQKAVAWHSDASSLERQGIPREFTTKSRVVIISNEWQTLNKNVGALQDRGHVLLFQPSAAEVHEQAGKWFDDQEIYQWFAANLHRVREPSLRHYVRARELKAAGMDWTEVLAAEAENPRARLAAELLASAAYGSTAERVKAFVEQGGGCRATFFNYRRSVGGATTQGA